MSNPMGMSEIAKHIKELESKCDDIHLHYADRIEALVELGLLQRDSHSMAKIFRRIQDIIKEI